MQNHMNFESSEKILEIFNNDLEESVICGVPENNDNTSMIAFY